MEGFVSAVAIEVGKCIAEPIKRQFNYLCSFNTNIQNLDVEATKLDDARVVVDVKVEAARRNAEVILPTVETWLQKVSRIQEERSGIETEIQNVKSGCLAIKSRFLVSRKAMKMAATMKVLLGDDNFEQIANPGPPAALASIPVGQMYELESRKHFEENIMAALKEKKEGMMGICGMGGVGKTTMAKQIMSRARGEDLFDEIVMVVVSQPVDLSGIQQQMAELLGLKLQDKTVSARAHRLRARLMKSKSILIILDDLWKALDLEELGIPDQTELKECTILLTSRDRDVFNAMNVQKTFQMKTLEDVEAWFLFKQKVGACADDQTLFPIAQEIVRECKGLPIALVTVGVALKYKTNKSSWESALQDLTSRNPQGIPEFLAQVYNPLKLSYVLLEDKQVKLIFLLCCLFPEDYNIRLSNLSLYAWGLGIFEGLRSVQAARNKVHASVETLKSHFLLLDDLDERYAKMHDVVRDVGIFIAKEEGLIDHNLDCAWIFLFHQLPEDKITLLKIMLPRGLVFPNLRLLLINGSQYGTVKFEKLPLCDNFFESARELHVLSIKGYIITSLPHTMQLLKNLRTLILSVCQSLEDISVVGELVSLEILCFHYCNHIKELPVEIGRLSQLKLLEVLGCLSLNTIAAGVISRLTRLEELMLIGGSFRKWESATSKGKNVALCELNCLSRLTTLKIQIADAYLAAEQIHLPNLDEFDIIIGDSYFTDKRSYRKQMLLKFGREVIIGDWIHQLLKTTERLLLEGEGSCQLLPFLPEFQSLKQLEIENAKMIRLIDGRSMGTTTGFPLLEFLFLEHIDDIEEIHNGPISLDYFKNLQEIKLLNLPKLQHLGNVVPLFCNLSSIHIEWCCSLRSIFTWAMTKDHLLRLKSLTIRSCSMLEQVVMWDEADARQSSSHNHRRITFPKLKTLELYDLPRLTSLCKGIDSSEFPILSVMMIKKCKNLKSLVSSKDGDSSHLFCKSDQAAFGKLKYLTIDRYDNICTERSLSLWCDQIQIGFFTGLGHLSLSKCGNIKTLFSVSIAINLVHLTELHIKSCSGVIKVIEDKFDEVERCPFNNLEVLSLVDLPKLKDFCDLRCAIQLPLLRKVSISKCPQMERFSSGSITSPISSDSFDNLEMIEIRSCSMLEQVMLWSEERNGHNINGRWVTFPKLKKLGLYDLPRLTSFCKGIQSIEFPLLDVMEIVKCPNLKIVVSSKENDKNCSGVINHNADHSLHLFCKSQAAFGRLDHLEIDGYESISYERSQSLWCEKIPIGFFTGLGHLSLRNCGNIKILFSLSITRNLMHLKKLQIASCREMVKVIEDKCNDVERCPFNNLEVLSLVDLPKLKAFCHWRCASELPSLREVFISNCPQMERFSSGSITTPISSYSFMNLQSMEIKYCTMLEQIVLWNEEENGKENINGQSSRSHIRIIFPKLKKLGLYDLPRLTSFCKGIQSIEFPLLTEMEIVKCSNLKSLVSSKENDKECLGTINHDADDSLHLSCKSQPAFDFLKLLTESSLCCDQMSMDFFTGLVHLDFFTRLVHLYVHNCGNIKSLFSPSIAGNLTNLRILVIECCGEMVEVIEGEEVEMSPLIKLEELWLEKLPKLKAFCYWRCALHFPLMRKVHISECPELGRFSSGSIITPNLEFISINKEDISNYTKDLNDALFEGDFHLEILFGGDE